MGSTAGHARQGAVGAWRRDDSRMGDDAARAALAGELADAFLDSPWTADSIAESAAGRLGGWPGWLESLTLSMLAVFRTAPVHDRPALLRAIEAFLAEHSVTAELEPRPQPQRQPPRLQLRRPDPVIARWPVAEVASPGALAERLELSEGQLAWLADVRSWERTVTDEKLRNYRYRSLPRADGLPRVIEAPKARLKEIQRWVLREILDRVPAHDAAHGFTPGRSAITQARRHVGQQVVVRFDLQDFFASIAAGRVYGLFRTLGYAPAVAHVFTGISTNVVPVSIWQAVAARAPDPRLVQRRFWLGRALATPHLPQGAPTSPALANLAAFRLDRRLAGLAAASGLRYSRYADDLTFSGAIQRRWLAGLEERVAAIVRDEGFRLNAAKSMVRAACARQSVCGIVVNQRVNIARGDYDELKAILHNAARDGAAAQNRSGVADFEAHLRGRIAWVSALHPARGEALRRRFDTINWSA